MKNKTFISFLINILIGILFSFPVFSSQGSLENYVNSCEVFFVPCDQSETFSSDSYNLSLTKELNYYQLTGTLPVKLYKINFVPGDDDNSFSDFSKQSLKDLIPVFHRYDLSFKNPYYVNLSYLKELKITKMLC